MHPAFAALVGFATVAPIIAVAWRIKPRREPRPTFRTSKRRWLWSAATGMAAGVLALVVNDLAILGSFKSIAVMVFAAAAPGIALCDAVTRRIPFAIAAALGATLAIALTIDLAGGGEWTALRDALIGAGIALLTIGSVAFFSGGGFARGDVVITAVYAAPLGMLELQAVAWWLLLSLAIAAIPALVRARQRGRSHRMPMGPFFMAAWVVLALLA